jgi:hypothetical protein
LSENASALASRKEERPMQKLGWLASCVQKTVRRATDRAQRLARDIVVGMLLSGSVVLCEIARALNPEKRAFETILHRLSENLGDKQLAGEVALIARDYLADAGRVTQGEYEYVLIDPTDVTKKYGRKMPFLDTVRDASESRRDAPKLGRGWWGCEIAATSRDHRVVPLHRAIWSTKQPGFRSETDELRKAILWVKPFVSPDALWVMDRGGDGDPRIALFDELLPRWTIRMVGNRNVWRPNSKDGPQNMLDVARAIDKSHKAWCWVSRDNKLVRVRRRFGWLTVQLDPGGKWYTLIAVERDEEADDDEPHRPLMLLTNIVPFTSRDGERVVAGYGRRWGVEDDTRSGKQLIDLENIRVLNWPAIVSLFLLSVVAQGLLALQEARNPRRAARLADEAPIVDPVPPYRIYRIWMRVHDLLAELAARLRRRPRRAWQLALLRRGVTRAPG